MKLKQCLLCVPVCPDSSIPVTDGKRAAFDYDRPFAANDAKYCGISVDGVIGNAGNTSGLICLNAIATASLPDKRSLIAILFHSFLKPSWKDLTEGMVICTPGTSKEFNTGEWIA